MYRVNPGVANDGGMLAGGAQSGGSVSNMAGVSSAPCGLCASKCIMNRTRDIEQLLHNIERKDKEETLSTCQVVNSRLETIKINAGIGLILCSWVQMPP